MAAETIKMCDMSVDIAAKVFVMLNQGKVRESDDGRNVILVTNTEPKDLIYPEGWEISETSISQAQVFMKKEECVRKMDLRGNLTQSIVPCVID